jgi:ribonuclease P protein subunit RPR2
MRKSYKEKKAKKGQAELEALLALADERTPRDQTVARQAVKDAFKLSQTLRLRIPREEKRKLCKHCYTYLKPGVTSSTRIAKGRIIITCLNCKHVKRLQYRK